MSNPIIVRIVFKWPTQEAYDIHFGPTGGFGPISDYITDTYYTTGKMLSRMMFDYPEKLERVVETTWTSNEERLAYMADPIVAGKISSLKQYLNDNGITSVWSNQEIDGENIVAERSGSWLE